MLNSLLRLGLITGLFLFLKKNKGRLFFLFLSLFGVYYASSQITEFITVSNELNSFCNKKNLNEYETIKCSEINDFNNLAVSLNFVIKNVLYLICVSIFILWPFLFSRELRLAKIKAWGQEKTPDNSLDPFEAIRKKDKLKRNSDLSK